MNDAEFSQAANHIADFLGATTPTATKLLAWMPKVKHIPAEAVAFIVEKITDEADRMPANLPKAFRDKFRIWQMENPGKCAAIVEQGCRDCERGVLFVERPDGKGRMQTAAVFCQCYAGSSGTVGRSTLAYLERQGWRNTKVRNVGFGSKADIADQLARARRDEQYPHPDRYDDYEDRHEESSW